MKKFTSNSNQISEGSTKIKNPDSHKSGEYKTVRDKFLGLSLESTRKSYYPQLKKQLEFAKELAEKYRQLVEYAPAGIYEFDMENIRFTSVNDVMCEYTGYTKEEFLKLDPFQLLTDESQKKFNILLNEVFAGNENPEPAEYKIIGKSNREFWVLVNTRFFFENGVPKRAIAVVHDLTAIRQTEEEKKQLEIQLHQSQKMESIGNLAGGIAHDFNNILSSIIGFTELALDEVEKNTNIEDSLQEVYAAGKRAKDLVKQILAFARQSEEERKPIQISSIVKEVLKLIRSSIPTTIDIKQKIDSESLIMGNPTQVHQIMMNLCSNAAYAMEDQGGTLEVNMTEISIDGIFNKKMPYLKLGDYIEIKVSDTGYGIPPEIINSIFEPYFSTKGPGEGTGMGLAMVRGIVDSYSGKITVDSKPGQGTVFTIYLPATRKRQEHHPYQSETLPTGKERILFVDDESSIAKMGGQALERLGYTVSIRTSSIEALELFRTKPNDFDLVITDMTMPNMTGDRLAIELMQIRPDIPVILCTGYSKRTSDETVTEMGIKALIYKPTGKADLSKTVRKVLDEAKGSSHA